MRRDRVESPPSWCSSWVSALVPGLIVALLAVVPAPLVPIARGYRAVCDRYPILAVITHHTPPLPLALLLTLAGLALLNGGRAGMAGLVGALRFNRRLRSRTKPLPFRLARAGRSLGLDGRLTFLEEARPAAFCYGFIRPRIALTAGLLGRLDDQELAAVLAHERQHLHRRDPARYLAIRTLTAAAFAFPVAPALGRRLEAGIELAADRAALAVASRGALAGALLAVLADRTTPTPGAARLTATEARIAHLSGHPVVPPIPTGAVVASLGLVAVIALTTAGLAAMADLVRMACALCPDLP